MPRGTIFGFTFGEKLDTAGASSSTASYPTERHNAAVQQRAQDRVAVQGGARKRRKTKYDDEEGLASGESESEMSLGSGSGSSSDEESEEESEEESDSPPEAD